MLVSGIRVQNFDVLEYVTFDISMYDWNFIFNGKMALFPSEMISKPG